MKYRYTLHSETDGCLDTGIFDDCTQFLDAAFGRDNWVVIMEFAGMNVIRSKYQKALYGVTWEAEQRAEQEVVKIEAYTLLKRFSNVAMVGTDGKKCSGPNDCCLNHVFLHPELDTLIKDVCKFNLEQGWEVK